MKEKGKTFIEGKRVQILKNREMNKYYWSLVSQLI